MKIRSPIAYTGNRPRQVGDLAPSPVYSGASELAEYNALNLPQKIFFTYENYILQTYSADGTLLRRVTQERKALTNMVTTTDLRGQLVYENTTNTQVNPFGLTRINTAHGFVAGGTPYYQVCDRRGSVRQVINGTSGQVERQYHYYPYGTLFGECTATLLQGSGADSPHRFEGKEQVSCGGMSLLDYPARPYDPLLLQFWESKSKIN